MGAIEDKLELLKLSKGFTVDELVDGSGSRYSVESVTWDLAAVFEDGRWSYYVTGCYDSGIDWMSIDMKELDRLVRFTRFLEGE